MIILIASIIVITIGYLVYKLEISRKYLKQMEIFQEKHYNDK